jgi:hypothetical protein
MDTAQIYSGIYQPSGDVKSLDKWIIENIAPFIKGRVIEIKSGIHSICSTFIEQNRPIHLSDTTPSTVQVLRAAYKGIKDIRDIHQFDFTNSKFQQLHSKTYNAFDTVLALKLSMSNFITAVDNLKYVLPKGGTLVLVLPADTYLYFGLGQNMEDWKRYNWQTIERIIQFGFSIIKVRYFNLPLNEEHHEFAHSGLSALAIFSKD